MPGDTQAGAVRRVQEFFSVSYLSYSVPLLQKKMRIEFAAMKMRSARTRVMDLANDERIKRLNQQIQQETDRDKVLKLTQELVRLLDGEPDKPMDDGVS